MITITNLKTMLAETMTKGADDIVVHVDTLKQIKAMRDKLVEMSGYDENNLTEADLILMHDILQFFKPEYMTQGTTIEDWHLMPAPQETFDACLEDMESKRGIISDNIFFPAILISNYVLEKETFAI